ncbi:hypothetical protein F3W96_19745 [Salmonella enterica]|nr:hypothetical protein [Salmonella enterica subsp. enterica serovar Sandiego]
MKRYHVISIAVLAGLIAGLALPVKADTLICKDTISQAPNLAPAVNAAVMTVYTEPNKATLTMNGVSMAFPMKRVINKEWKKESPDRMYTGRVEGAELIIAVMPSASSPLTVQYRSTTKQGEYSLMGLNCEDIKQ